MVQTSQRFVRAATIDELKETGSISVHLEGLTIGLFVDGDRIFAIDNRCPHMGFPLTRGSVKDCILTCHWHEARFDLSSGGTFDPWADDVRAFPVELRDGEVWVDLAPKTDVIVQQRKRLQESLERNISLVMAKSVISLLQHNEAPEEPFRIGLEFGTRHGSGWGQGLTMHACFMNLLPHLNAGERPRALYHGLSAVGSDSARMPERFILRPLPGSCADFSTLKRWFRQFIEVRDSEGAERCIVTALQSGLCEKQMADMLFSAVTDHRYIQIGHPLDFTNKAFEALDHTGWEHAEPVLTSLVSGYANASRMEESNSWRHPINLVAMLENAFELLPAALQRNRSSSKDRIPKEKLVRVLLGDDPAETSAVLFEALETRTPVDELAGIVAYAAALRILYFHTSNEFGDWDRALHTFTFANAVHQGLRRANTPELVRGVFDAAMSIYLDRFLNVPPARLTPVEDNLTSSELLSKLPEMLNRQQQVNEAGGIVTAYLAAGHSDKELLAMIGELLLREDRNFHTIQMVDAAFKQYSLHRNTLEGTQILAAAARYLAAHSPTVRSQGQTYRIASRLHRGEKLFEE